jgi:hypothetical protein
VVLFTKKLTSGFILKIFLIYPFSIHILKNNALFFF